MNLRRWLRNPLTFIRAALVVPFALLIAPSATLAQVPATAIGTSSGTLTATVPITGTGAAASIAVLTQGSQTLDFVLANPNSGSCAVGMVYTSGQTCTVQFTFTPTHPFTRYGSATVYDALGNVLGNVFLAGVGTGPQVSYPLGAASTVTTLGAGFSRPAAVAVDAAGNIYIADTQNNAVKEIKAADGSIVTLGSGFNTPSAVAIDGSGNVYVADAGNNAVKEILANNGVVPTSTSPIILTLASNFSFSNPQGVAVDGSGNVFVADKGNAAVEEIIAVNGVIPATSPTVNALGSGFTSPVSVAVDAAGNVFVADSGANALKEIPAAGGTVTSLGTGLSSPQGVSVDGLGNIFVGDLGNNAVKEFLAVSGSVPGTSATVVTLGSGFMMPSGVAVDALGNLFIADAGNNAIRELAQAAPALTFASTALGVASTDSPQTVTIQNSGNAALVVAIPTIGTNPAASASFQPGAGSTCPVVASTATATGSIAGGTTCTYAVSFTPVMAGTITGSLTLTDNSLNASNAAQTFALNGTATPGTPTVSVASPSVAVGATSVTLSASVAYAGVPPTGAFTFTVNSGAPITASCTGSATPLTCTAAYDPSSLVAGSYMVQGTIAQDSNYNSTSSNGTLTVTMATPAVSLSSSGSPSTVNASVTLTARVTPASGITPTGNVTFTASLNGTTSGIPGCTSVALSNHQAVCVTTALSAGTNSIGASVASDSNFTVASATPITQTVAAASTTLATTSSLPNSASVDQAVTFTATLSGSAAFTIAPAGTVKFTANGTTIPGCAASPVSTSTFSASCIAYALIAPSDLIAATYTSGDANYTGSTAPTLGQVVAKTTPVNSIASSLPASAAVNQPVTFTATITPPGASSNGVTPTGSVTFTNGAGGPQICSPVVVSAGANGTGTASCSTSFSAVSAGTAIYAAYSGDSNFAAGNSPSVSQTVSKSNTSIAASSITTNPSSPTVNQSNVVLNATITASSSGSTQPGGTVTFSDTSAGNPTNTCVSNVNSGVVAGCSIVFTTTGTHTVTAVYSGDANFSGTSNSNTVSVVSSGTVTINVTTSATPVVENQSVTYSATFSPVQAGPTYPAGTVQYFDGSTAIAGCNVTVSATGTIPNCTETLTVANTHVISAVFTSANNNFNNITSGNLAQVVNQNTTRTALTAPSATSTVDQVVTFAATVTPTVLTPAAVGTTAPGGTVLFNYVQGGVTTVICVAPVSTTAGITSASCSAALTAAASYSISAVYSGDLNFTTSTSNPYSQVVGKTGTSLGVATGSTFSSPAAPAVNQAAAYTVQLSLANSISSTGLTAPTGNVTFTDSASSLTCTARLASGQASCSLAEPTAGTHNIVAAYAGDANFSASSATFSVSIAASTTSIAAASIFTNPSSPTVNATGAALNATLTAAYAGTAMPSGTLIFTDAATGVATTTCSTTVTNGTVAPCAHVFTTAGTHTITAAYQGDANFSAVSQSSSIVVVGVGALTVALTSTTGPVTVNQQATYGAVFSPAQSGPTYPAGSVQFFDGGTAIPGCNSAVSATGTITSCNEITATAGTHVITATFTSTNPTNFANANSGNLPQVVNQNTTKTALTAPSAPSSVNQVVSFAAILTPSTLTPAATGTTIPTGTITFNSTNSNGVTVALCAGTVSTTSGVTSATCTAPFTAAATYAVAAMYSGDANFVASTSPAYSQVVNKTTTAVSLASGSVLTSPASPAANQSATYTVQVTPSITSSGLIQPTGNVIFTDSTPSPAVGCTAVLVSSTGLASCSFATTGNGPHNIVATYTGDTNFVTSTQTFVETIALATPVLTITQPTVNPTINLAGFSFNATIAVPAGSTGQPTGTVTFTDSATGTVPCVSSIGAGVVPPCAYIFGTAGAHTITAAYSGDKSFSSTTSSIQITVAPATPAISLVSAAPVSIATQQVTFTATVTPSPSAFSTANGTPTGTISFSFPQGSILAPCTPTIASSGGSETATCVVTFATYAATGTGSYNVTATYSGDANYNTTQRALIQNVQSFTPGLNPGTIAVGQGDSNTTDPYATGTSITYSITAQDGFSNATVTSCLTPVVGLTCTVPATFSVGSAVKVVVTATSSVAPGVYTLQVITKDTVSSLSQSTPLSVTVIGRVYPTGSTIAYSVPTVGQVTIPFTLPAGFTGSTYSCNQNVANANSNGTYSQTGDTLANLGLACSVTGSGSNYILTITAGSGLASLERRPLDRIGGVFAASLFAPFLLALGFCGRTKRTRRTLVRFMAIGLLTLATLYTAGCGGGFSRGANQTFAVGGSYLIGVNNAAGATVTEIPLLVTGNGAGI